VSCGAEVTTLTLIRGLVVHPTPNPKANHRPGSLPPNVAPVPVIRVGQSPGWPGSLLRGRFESANIPNDVLSPDKIMPMQSSATVSATKKVPMGWRILGFGASFWRSKPLSVHEGTGGELLLEVNLPDDCCDFPYYELVEEGKPYREWCIPAAIINQTW
jgi:hypothetical protein